MAFQTADLCDEHGDKVQVLELPLTHYGQRRSFAGEAVTLKLFEDNSLVRQKLEQPGAGRVLIVDGGGSRRCALVGDQLAKLGADNGWAGVVVYGCIRDAAELARIELGVLALGTCPRKSLKRNQGDQDITVRFGGVTIRPGMSVYADEDGVIVAAEPLVK